MVEKKKMSKTWNSIFKSQLTVWFLNYLLQVLRFSLRFKNCDSINKEKKFMHLAALTFNIR